MFKNDRWKLKNEKSQETSKPEKASTMPSHQKEQEDDFSKEVLTTAKGNADNIQKMLANPNDLDVRVFPIGDSELKGALIGIDGLVDKANLQENVLEKILFNSEEIKGLQSKELLTKIEDKIITTSVVNRHHSLDKVMLHILDGDTAFFLDGVTEVLIISSKGWDTRGIEEPQSEALVRGPREGFIEDLRTNTMMIRRQIRDPNLRFEAHRVGRRAKKHLVVAYIDGIVHPMLLKEVNRRLKTIDIDGATDSGIIEQWIEDSFLSPFPQLQNTERPDRTAAALLEGKVAILVDGTPFVLLLPTNLSQMFASPEDYHERWIVSSLIRVLRYVAAFIAMFLPALYIALVSYHPGMIPSTLAFSITASREGVPVPAVVEALMMEATMELLREAGIRLPKAIGQTIGIVGGLVIGEAAVAAGIVSPIMVIIVALTAISSFAIPSYSMSIGLRFLRFHFMLAAAVFGLYGIIIGYIMINIHIANLKSFGVPYSTPFAPMLFKDWKDLVLRLPFPMNDKRPVTNQPIDDSSQKKGGDNK